MAESFRLPELIGDENLKRIKKDFPLPKNGECPTCEGLGEYVLNSEILECDCHTQKLLIKHYFSANIPKRYHVLGIDSFGDDRRKENKGVIEEIEKYLSYFDQNYRYGNGLAFYGPQGTGKTLLAVHILKETVKLGYSGYFIQFSDLINTWASSWKDAESKEQLENDMKRRQVLVLDDITTDKRNAEGFLQSGLEAVLRHRYNNNLPTILTTNMREAQMERDFFRPYSLISGVTTWLTLEGSDFRPTNLENTHYLIEHGEVLPVT